jgi:amino acid permease
MESLFLENYASLLKSLHGGIGILSLFTLGFGVYLIIKRRAIDWSSGLKSSLIGILAYLFSFVLGLLIYPVFRVKVRAEYFDPKIPWATGLFEIKEYVGAIGLLIAFVLLGYYLFFKIDQSEKPVKQSFINLLFVLFLITLFKTIVGIILGFLKSI